MLLIVFSDLDGTLLDHDTYAFDAARPALARLQALNIPLILASSKTSSEIRELQNRMGITDYPAIVENGAGVLWPEEDGNTGSDYDRLRIVLADTPVALARHFKGFDDMSTTEVARVTEMPVEHAQRAKDRRFTEPGIWSGTDQELDAFLEHLATKGVRARQGGRFLTVSFGARKSDQMATIAERLGRFTTIALGDAPNDAEMLEMAEHPVIIRNDHAPAMPHLRTTARIRHSALSGPAGWNTEMMALLDLLMPKTTDD